LNFPRGALAPAHAVIFTGLAKAIAERAERRIAGEKVAAGRHPWGNVGASRPR
jgi:hypothetical protein